jgi:hypothetical protein
MVTVSACVGTSSRLSKHFSSTCCWRHRASKSAPTGPILSSPTPGYPRPGAFQYAMVRSLHGLRRSNQFDHILANAGISRLFEDRPRALWISAPPPPSRYAVSSRRVCLVLNPRIAAAEISVRRRARTSDLQKPDTSTLRLHPTEIVNHTKKNFNDIQPVP